MAFDGTESRNSDSGVASVFERKIGVRPFGAAIQVNDTEMRQNIRGWALAKGINSGWVERAKDYQLAALYSNPKYHRTVSNLKPGEIFGESGSSNDRARTSSVPRTIPSSTLSAADLVDTDDEEDIFQPKPRTPPALSSFDPIPDGKSGKMVSLDDLAKAAGIVLGPKIEAAEKKLEAALDEKIKNAKLSLSPEARQQIKEIAREAGREVLAGAFPQRIEISNVQTGASIDLGYQHQDFPKLLKMSQARNHQGYRLNLWMTGPTGSGKTTAATNVARALEDQFTRYRKNSDGTWTMLNEDGSEADLNGMSHDAPWAADSSLDADYKVVGHQDGYGKFHWTPFLRIFAFGGIYIADEIDNWAPSALIAMNAPLANNWVSTPIGTICRHKDCLVIAAANTWGLGATDDYVARRKLDAATVNRFPNKIHWDIDEKLEKAVAMSMAGLEGENWCNQVQAARKAAKAAGLKVIFSPRNTYEGISMLQVGFSVSEVIEMNLLAGLDHSQKLAISGAVR